MKGIDHREPEGRSKDEGANVAKRIQGLRDPGRF